MALAGTTIFEVRTTGDDINNAGAFNPSRSGATTDYSLLSPLAFSDLTLATTTTATSASIGFTSAHIGNHMRIVSGTGFTAGLYEITAVSGGTATLDRSPGASGISGGTGRLGGFLASPGQAAGLKVAGNTVYWKGGTYTFGAGTANTAGKVVADTTLGYWIGYDTVRGDNTGTRPLVQSGANLTTLFAISGQWSLVENVAFSPGASAVTTAVSLGGGSCLARNCTISGSGGTFTNGVLQGGAAAEVEDCLIQTCTRGISITSSGRVVRSTLLSMTGGSNSGIEFGAGNSGNAVIENCTIANGAGIGLSCGAGSPYLRNLVIYGNTGKGLTLSDTIHAENIISYGNTGTDIDLGGSITLTQASRLAALAAGTYGAGIPGIARVDGRLTLTANPFTNAAALDFTLNNLPGGGALLRAAGWPATLPGLAGTSYPDIGAYQSAPTVTTTLAGLPAARVFTGY